MKLKLLNVFILLQLIDLDNTQVLSLAVRTVCWWITKLLALTLLLRNRFPGLRISVLISFHLSMLSGSLLNLKRETLASSETKSNLLEMGKLRQIKAKYFSNCPVSTILSHGYILFTSIRIRTLCYLLYSHKSMLLQCVFPSNNKITVIVYKWCFLLLCMKFSLTL